MGKDFVTLPLQGSIETRLPQILALLALPVTQSVFRSQDGTMCCGPRPTP